METRTYIFVVRYFDEYDMFSNSRQVEITMQGTDDPEEDKYEAHRLLDEQIEEELREDEEDYYTFETELIDAC
jgi:predicted NAD-dependent protein-ADP-ribosyltransferase YbiA (DUF1768 family)